MRGVTPQGEGGTMYLCGQGGEGVVGDDKALQVAQLPNLHWDGGQLVVAGIQHAQTAPSCHALCWKSYQLVALYTEEFEVHKGLCLHWH